MALKQIRLAEATRTVRDERFDMTEISLSVDTHLGMQDDVLPNREAESEIVLIVVNACHEDWDRAKLLLPTTQVIARLYVRIEPPGRI